MWKVENLGSCKTLFFLKDVRKPTTLLETFFEMLEIIQWFVATGGASSKKKKNLYHIQNSIMNQMFVFSQNFYVESLTSNMMLSGDGAFGR